MMMMRRVSSAMSECSFFGSRTMMFLFVVNEDGYYVMVMTMKPLVVQWLETTGTFYFLLASNVPPAAPRRFYCVMVVAMGLTPNKSDG
jgi:hypothetical protein